MEYPVGKGVKQVGVKEVKGYLVLKTGEELEKELRERLERGEKLVKIVWCPTVWYLKHLKERKIPHIYVKVNRYEDFVIVDVTHPNFKPLKGVVGLAETYYVLEGRKLDKSLAREFRRA